MLWIRLRYVAAVTLAVGIASGGASVYVCGSQEPAPKDGQPVSNRPTTTTAQGPQPKISKKATGQPKTAELRSRLHAQRLATLIAKAVYEIARLTRELAELAVEEYEEVTYPRDLATVRGEIKLAESDLARSKASEELNFKKAQFTLEQAQSKKKVLVDYTREKTIKELESEVKKAKSDELAKQAAWDSERSKEKELERQLRHRTD
jgi:hypothetical protein